jgi:hypothetical protein
MKPESEPATTPQPGSITPATETKPPYLNEDWLSVLTGLLLFLLSLAVFLRLDLLGWAVTTAVWTKPTGALGSISKNYAGLPGLVYLAATYVFLSALLGIGAAALRINVGRFLKGFAAVFFASYLAWFIGSWAYIAATPDKRKALDLPGRSASRRRPVSSSRSSRGWPSATSSRLWRVR